MCGFFVYNDSKENSMSRVLVGSIWTDTGSLIIGDPCQLLSSQDGDAMCYEKLLSLVYPESSKNDRMQELANRGDLNKEEILELVELMKADVPVVNSQLPIPNMTGGTAALNLLVGSDGYYPVYLEKDETGERIVIELGGKIQPAKE